MDASFLLLPDAPVHARSRKPETVLPDEGVSMHIRRYGARQRVYSAGDPARTIHEVAQGCVLVSRYLGDGRRQIIDIVGPGRLFGFASDLHHCTAETTVASMVCSLDRNVALTSPAVSNRVHTAMLREIDQLQTIAVLLGRKTAIERVATLLVGLCGGVEDGPANLSLPVTRSEMADYLGLTIETISRTLTRLKQSGLIGLPDAETVRITNVARLHHVACGDMGEAA